MRHSSRAILLAVFAVATFISLDTLRAEGAPVLSAKVTEKKVPQALAGAVRLQRFSAAAKTKIVASALGSGTKFSARKLYISPDLTADVDGGYVSTSEGYVYLPKATNVMGLTANIIFRLRPAAGVLHVAECVFSDETTVNVPFTIWWTGSGVPMTKTSITPAGNHLIFALPKITDPEGSVTIMVGRPVALTWYSCDFIPVTQ